MMDRAYRNARILRHIDLVTERETASCSAAREWMIKSGIYNSKGEFIAHKSPDKYEENMQELADQAQSLNLGYEVKMKG